MVNCCSLMGRVGSASDTAMSRVAAGEAGGSGEACCCCSGMGEPGFGGGDGATAASAVPVEPPAAKTGGLVAGHRSSKVRKLRRQLAKYGSRLSPCKP